MMHMIKLCVGVATLEELESYREERAHWWGADYGENVHVHRTRTMPKRRAEMEGIGSIYWVIRGQIACRERILAVRPFVDKEGIGRCHLVLDPKCVLVDPRPFRAFQGWRYLEVKDAPRDLERAAPGASAMPEPMRRELRDLGLI